MAVFTCITAGYNFSINCKKLSKALQLAYNGFSMNLISFLYSAVMVVFMYVTAEYKERRAQR